MCPANLRVYKKSQLRKINIFFYEERFQIKIDILDIIIMWRCDLLVEYLFYHKEHKVHKDILFILCVLRDLRGLKRL
jgi:hypothetical protein